MYRDALTPWKDQPSFNCLVETLSYGDERAFLDARPVHETAAGSFRTVLNVAPGDRLMLRVYIHNCADPALNDASPPRGDAVDTRVRIITPTDPSDHVQVYAFIVAANARPEWVADGLDLHSVRPVRLRVVSGTARLFGNRLPKDGVRLGDDGFIDSRSFGPHGPATVIGSDILDGVVPADGFGSELVLQVEAEVS